MSSAKQPNFKRSIDGIFNVFATLKNQKTGEVDKPLKAALFNVGVLVILAALVGVFLVLGPFLKPLLWSFLFGAVLFPAKKKLSTSINSFITHIETNETPIAIGILLFPVNGLVKLGEIISRWLIDHMKFLFMGSCAIISLNLIIRYVPTELYSGIIKILMWHHELLGKVVGSLNLTLVFLMLVSYVLAVVILWNSSSSNVFIMLGQLVWIFIVAYFSSFFGSLQIPAFIFFMIYAVLGIFYDEKNQNGSEIVTRIKRLFKKEATVEEPADEPLSKESESAPVEEFPKTPMGRLLKTKVNLSEIKQKMQLSLHPEHLDDQEPQKPKQELESDTYFKYLFYACAATVLWNQMWIFFLCLIPVSCYAIKELFKILGFWNLIKDQWKNKYSKVIDSWLEPRRHALLPICLPGILQLNTKLHKFMCTKLKSFVDDISSVVMILLLVFIAIFLSVFFFFQIYSETIAVAQLGSDLVNRTLTLRPDLVEMLPINMQSMNDVIDNAYKYSRSTIEDYIDNLFNQTNPEQAGKLKIQILSVWDRLIQSYMDRNNEGIVGPRVSSESVFSTIDEIVTTSGVTYSGLFSWAQSNIGMLMEVSDSLWIVLKANLNLLLSTFTTLFSVVLGGGHAMIKFLFNSIIFFTTLYYLLQSSQDRYVPIAMNINSAWGSRLTDALEDSVSSVLVATMKVSLFHGLFTWLTHTAFGAHVVYLPSILATVLAAAPFLETYWCCFPAFLDLWLSQDRFYLGLILVLVHFIIPPNFNPIVHSEIKGGGHPYLTALSIVGGMYLFGGVEGAILGPLLLCLLVVLSTVTVNSLNSPPSTLSHRSSIESHSIASPAITNDWEKRNKLSSSNQNIIY